MILNTISSKDLLIHAYKFYSRGDARAHDALKIIIDRNDMTSAVQGCLDEATREEELDKQLLFIQAACFGKKFHPGIAIEEFQNTCRSLRVANICRAQNLDPTLELEVLIDKLLERKQFSLALWIVRWLKVEGEKRILINWSEHLIGKSFLRDEEVAAKIQEKLGRDPIVPYADIANKAIEHNRHKLAIRLIEHEGQSVKQIPLLLSLKQYDLVLAQALATCDSNLIFMAIFKLEESIFSEERFRELLKKHPLAFKYYCNLLSIIDIPKLILIAHSDNNFKDELALCLLDNRLESALAVSKRHKQEFVASHIDMRLRLNKFQQSLKLDPPPKAKQSTWLGLSVCETIINLVASSQMNKAKDCQKRFEISDRKFKALEQIALNSLPKRDNKTVAIVEQRPRPLFIAD